MTPNDLNKITPETWEMLVRQQLIEGWTFGSCNLVAAVGALALTYWLSKLFVRYYKLNDSEPAVAGCLVGGVTCLLVAVINLSMLPDRVLQVINPESYTIQKFLAGGCK